MEEFDLVFVEFNINDHFIPKLAHGLEDKGEVGNKLMGKREIYVYIVIFHLLYCFILTHSN